MTDTNIVVSNQDKINAAAKELARLLYEAFDKDIASQEGYDPDEACRLLSCVSMGTTALLIHLGRNATSIDQQITTGSIVDVLAQVPIDLLHELQNTETAH